ncbi:hypothetical protein H9Y04_11345 [Streptomyces sp. TRM66268-LWL]|uniref:Uncharacterized protein n=1 Tax=Streptomyces polyasparticus TaxID=2767826 RepID=A0ABR7SCF2_9ACTN|nr:hypothetical protein [Streptomyces polyasparticus]MBC9713165.1 hypothetical protein [Streptomyces polyasparticus]
MTDHALRLLHRAPRLAALAAFPFDFDLDRAAYGHVEPVRLASGGGLEILAGDDTGGTFFRCDDGSVLYASSEGGAGLLGSNVDEALDILTGLPGWRDHLGLSPQDGEEAIRAAVAETEDSLRESYGIDAERTELRAALGFPDRSPAELIGMLYAALQRTEPGFVLLNAEEGRAYRLLDDHPRPPLWEPVLAAGRRDFAALRAGDEAAWQAMADDPVRRRLALRAAQFDRADEDLPVLLRLLPYEAESSMTDELRLACVLIGLHGRAEHLPLLDEVRHTDFDTACGLSDIPDPDADGSALRQWALGLDDAMVGADPADEPLEIWTDLAADQGLTEYARVPLIRRLDEIELDQSLLRDPRDPGKLNSWPLSSLASDFERLGDLFQALRARRLYTALQETAWDRVSALRDLAGLERRAGELEAAVRTLSRLRTVLDAPGDDSLEWLYRVNLGRFVVREHDELARALTEAGASALGAELREAADGLRGQLA